MRASFFRSDLVIRSNERASVMSAGGGQQSEYLVLGRLVQVQVTPPWAFSASHCGMGFSPWCLAPTACTIHSDLQDRSESRIYPRPDKARIVNKCGQDTARRDNRLLRACECAIPAFARPRQARASRQRTQPPLPRVCAAFPIPACFSFAHPQSDCSSATGYCCGTNFINYKLRFFVDCKLRFPARLRCETFPGRRDRLPRRVLHPMECRPIRQRAG